MIEFIFRANPESRNSTSEPNLTTAGDKPWSSGFPPGTTVDELYRYRRKRFLPSIDLYGDFRSEPGSYAGVKSEYQQKFINYYHLLGGSCDELLHYTREDISPVRAAGPEDTLKLEGAHELFQSEYNESFIEHPIETQMKCRPRNSFNFIDPDGETSNLAEDTTTRQDVEPSAETKSQENTGRVSRKNHPYRRPTTLRLEGEFQAVTEHAEKFIRFLLAQRPDLARKATTLKLEGEMDTKTEMREKYVPLDQQKRPPLCKKSTNLHLEGEMNIISEKQDMYKPFEVQKRPPLSRHNSNLHLEGELELFPEYRREYVKYEGFDRPKPVMPVNNLKSDGFYDVQSNVSKPFEQQIHPQIPFLRGGIDDFGVRPRESGRSTPMLTVSKSDSHLNHVEDAGQESGSTFSGYQSKEPRRSKRQQNNMFLEGRIDMNPEYRNAYIDYSRDSKTFPTRGRSRRKDNLKSEGEMEISPEYSDSYINFPRERPRLRKPECSLSSEGEWDHMTEKREKYVSYPNIARTEKVKREPELKLEGHFECQPEYRKAYIDYLIRERIERKPRPIDNLSSRKAFALVNDSNTDEEQVKPRRKERSPTIAPAKPRSSKQNLKPPQPRKASSSSSTSVPPSPRPDKRGLSSDKLPRNRSLSKIEASVFGAKLTVPPTQYGSRSSSRSTSPLPSRPEQRIGSRNVSPVQVRIVGSPVPMRGRVSPVPIGRRVSPVPKGGRVSPAPMGARVSPIPTRRRVSPVAAKGRDVSPNIERRRVKKFDSPVRVENLAHKQSVSPLPPVIDTCTRRKWMREDSGNSGSAFVVLDKEINNNDVNEKNVHQRNLISRESKWMPSWYSPP